MINPTNSSKLSTPVLFLTFNRLETTKQVFATISQAQPTRLYIACDGPRDNCSGEAKKVEAVREYVLQQIDWDCKVQTLFREENLGCKYAVSTAIDWFFQNEDMGIILEDDCLPSQSFFYFCQDLLDKYKHDERVMSIVGYNVLSGRYYSDYDYLFSNIGFSWGWATWRRAWSYFDIEMKDWKYAKNQGIINAHPFNKKRNQIFEKTYNQEINSWFYIWDFYKAINSGLSVVPTQSLIKNIGFGKEATHTKETSSNRAKINHKEISFPLKHPKYVIWDNNYEEHFWKLRDQENSLLKKIENKISKISRKILVK